MPNSDLPDFLIHIMHMDTMDELWRTLSERLEGYGIKYVAYLFSRYPVLNGFTRSDDIIFRTNMSDSFIAAALTSSLRLHLPRHEHHVNLPIATPFHETMRRLKAKSLRSYMLLETANLAGFRAGYALRFPSVSSRAFGGMGVMAPRYSDVSVIEKIWAEHGTEITAICNAAHLKIITLPDTYGRKLTQRQREVLEWAGEGKTIQDIGEIMNLTPATIEKHMKLARDALDVETTTQAVLKASMQNIMFPFMRGSPDFLPDED